MERTETKSKQAMDVKDASDTKPSKKSKEKGEDLEAVAAKVVKDYRASREYIKSGYEQTWDDCFKAYNNRRTYYGYDGIADTFVPLTFGLVETELANIASTNPKMSYRPTHKYQPKNTKLLNSLVDEYWNRADMPVKILPWIRDMIMYGTGVLYTGWCGDLPEISNIALRDFLFDPNSKSPLDPMTEFMGYQFFGNKAMMEDQKELDPDTGDEIDRYMNLDKVTEVSGDSDDQVDKEVKDILKGANISGEIRAGQMHCIYHVTPEYITVVANLKHVIYRRPNWFCAEDEQKTITVPTGKFDDQGDLIETKVTVEIPGYNGCFPFAIMRCHIDGSQFLGKGEVEVILPTQENLNDTANQTTDNLSYKMNVMWTLDPEFADRKEEVQSVPGIVLTFPQGALMPVERPTFDAGEGYKEMDRLKGEARQALGVDEITMGTQPDSGVHTATELNLQSTMANKRFAMKINTLQNEGFKTLADRMFKLIQIFVDEKETIRVATSNGIDFQEYDPDEYWGEYTPHVQLEVDAEMQKAKDQEQALAMYAQLKDNERIDQTELLRIVIEKGFDVEDEERDKLIMSEEKFQAMQQQKMQQEAAMAQASQPPAPGMEADPNAQDQGPDIPENFGAGHTVAGDEMDFHEGDAQGQTQPEQAMA